MTMKDGNGFRPNEAIAVEALLYKVLDPMRNEMCRVLCHQDEYGEYWIEITDKQATIKMPMTAGISLIDAFSNIIEWVAEQEDIDVDAIKDDMFEDDGEDDDDDDDDDD